MNLLSFPIFLAIWSIFALVFFLLLKNDESYAKKNRFLLIFGLCFVAALLPVYCKVALSQELIFYSSDESGLKANYETFVKGTIVGTHSSGPAILILLQMLAKLTGMELDNVINFFGVIAAALTVVTIIVFFKKATKNYWVSIGGACCAIYSSYLIWSIIEVKPQQIGFLLFLFIAMLFFDALKNRNAKALVLTTFFIACSPFLHILSHFFLLPLVLLTIFFMAISKKDFGNWEFFAGLAAVIAWFASLFFSFSIFEIVFDFHFLIKRFMIGFLGFSDTGLIFDVKKPIQSMPLFKFSYPLAGLTAIILLATLSLLVIVFWKRRTISRATVSFFGKIKEIDNQKLFKYAVVIGLFLIAVQIVLHLQDIRNWYFHPIVFVIFETGNLLIGLLALYGLSCSIAKRGNDGIQKVILPTISLAVLFVINLATGFVMMKGFENFSMRTMNYLIVFLGFFAFIGITKIKREKLKTVALVLVLLFPTAFVVGTRDPSIIDDGMTYLPISEDPPLFQVIDIIKDSDYNVTFLNILRHTDENYLSKDLLISTRMWDIFKK